MTIEEMRNLADGDTAIHRKTGDSCEIRVIDGRVYGIAFEIMEENAEEFVTSKKSAEGPAL